MNVLVTGGAGFIGTNLTRKLLTENCHVTILDNFSEQIHGTSKILPPDIAGSVNLIVGDVRDPEVVARALQGQDVLVHLAAETGTGQSMYEVVRYEDVNLKGTAVIFDYLVNNKNHSIHKIVVASSRAVYGEGKYSCTSHGVVYPSKRKTSDLKAGLYDPLCPVCNATCSMLPTDEEARFSPSSFYGITKQIQEQMTLLFAESMGLSAYALRYQNVYGPGQSLKNPYTGILAIFSNLARAGQPIYIFEDGQESRDFVYIDDVVEATWRSISHTTPNTIAALNVGSGEKTTVLEVVEKIVSYFGSSSKINVNGAFRDGDIRHNLADITRIREKLGYEPRTLFAEGINKFLAWAETQQLESDKYEASLNEMKSKGLLHG
ncbi:SDR family NAD(P)-dependent oxidoreductase [Geotalea uraniireducens]|uniref:NAD-dependent epimerase/dehydratase n=1 Tax=Geotalea uraniireducens (strain Rf4) TaxID=351605 RepID=A5G6C9_GEOUR|nr:SDR family NAD(P)-dependent oxidoreductase [Geotalea uraniireducens]ABQ27347.1 NAD-dependent epimerase/dehydratase [Geotalea uraniireducens Rf4]